MGNDVYSSCTALVKYFHSVASDRIPYDLE